MSDKITIAVSKGRIFDEALPLLAKIDVIPKDDPQNSRKLILETNKNIPFIFYNAIKLNHFTIVRDLANPNSDLAKKVLKMCKKE